jgi:hypothetical protein
MTLLRDLEAALRASHGDTDAERLERAAQVFTRHAARVELARVEAGLARTIAVDLREIASRLESK